MRLNELFDQDIGDIDTKTGKNRFNFNINGQDYFVLFDSDGGDYYRMFYGYADRLEKYIPNSRRAENPQTSKDGIKVLSTVVAYTEKFIKQATPEIIEFSGARELGLDKLYNKMARVLSSRVKALGYKIAIQDNFAGAVDFFILKNDRNVPDDFKVL